MTVTQAHTRITWTIRPVIFLPLYRWLGTKVPASAYEFRSQSDG
jgi:hypothetical protein